MRVTNLVRRRITIGTLVVLLLTTVYSINGYSAIPEKKPDVSRIVIKTTVPMDVMALERNVIIKKQKEMLRQQQQLELQRKIEEARKNQPVMVASRGAVDGHYEETKLLEKLVMAEAEGESLNGKIAVANVVLNRTHSNKYPSTITGVIYQKGQFSSARYLYRITPDEETVQAVNQAMNGYKVVGDSVLYYINPKTAEDHTIAKTKKLVIRIGHHNFYTD